MRATKRERAMPAAQKPFKQSMRRNKGFRHTASLLDGPLRKVGEARGFPITRLLTQWEEILGQDLAKMCQPVKVSYSRGGFGATLTVLSTGSMAPMLEMQLPQVRERVNACYGYNAISRVRITQTATTGFAEGQAAFQHKPKRDVTPDRAHLEDRAQSMVEGVQDEGLRAALQSFGTNVMSKAKGSLT